jgi:hypothetical protein
MSTANRALDDHVDGRSGRPALVVTVDTEEEGRWSASYPAFGNTCLNVSRLPRIHRIFTQLGVTPTYLVDYPVAADPEARDVIAGFADDGRAEVGAHMHPWCNPPLGGEVVQGGKSAQAATFPHNLPPAIQRAKLERLCDAIQEGFGARPTSYRAGRWGFDSTSVPILEKLGIELDTSVNSLWWYPGDSGPSFVGAPLHPYRIDRADVCRPGDSGVVEVPTSALVVAPYGPVLEKMIRVIGPVRGLRRVLRKAGLRFLKPEIHGLDEMRELANAMVGRGHRVFNVTFHSSVALPGATPYVVDDSALDEFCRRLEGILEHVLVQHRAKALALSDVPAFLGEFALTGRSA